MYSYTLILKDKYSNKYIFISHTLAENDIKSLNSRILKQNNLRLDICMQYHFVWGDGRITFALSDITTQITRLRLFCFNMC